jgi:Double zinc ribbon
MSVRADVEEIETTKAEKLLAVVLAVFLLVGGIWVYTRLDDWTHTSRAYALTPAEQAAVSAADRARSQLAAASVNAAQARQDLELKREAYRTALEAHQPTARLRAQYVAAQAELKAAQARQAAAHQSVLRLEPAAEQAQAAAARRADRSGRHDDLWAALLRIAFVLAWLAAGLALLVRLHKRRSRYEPTTYAVVGAGAVLVLVFASDYVGDYISWPRTGPLVLSLVGIAATLAVFAVLQRYVRRLTPVRRVRSHRCPFCGYPVQGNEHCEGCGRDVVGKCSTCGEPRRVGTRFCGACGAG